MFPLCLLEQDAYMVVILTITATHAAEPKVEGSYP